MLLYKSSIESIFQHFLKIRFVFSLSSCLFKPSRNLSFTLFTPVFCNFRLILLLLKTCKGSFNSFIVRWPFCLYSIFYVWVLLLFCIFSDSSVIVVNFFYALFFDYFKVYIYDLSLFIYTSWREKFYSILFFYSSIYFILFESSWYIFSIIFELKKRYFWSLI